MIKPLVNNIVSIYFFNERKPLITGEGDKESAKGIRYLLFCWHCIKLEQYAIDDATSPTAAEDVVEKWICYRQRNVPTETLLGSNGHS